jgi:gluconolactonase
VRSEVVATGIPFAEGPVWCPDGSVVTTSVAGGALHRITPATGHNDRFAVTLGGANGAALAADGSILVAQNGGIDFSGFPGPFSELPSSRPTAPALQLAEPDGSVRTLATEGLLGPNDVAVSAEGTVFFTDPGHFPPASERPGRIMAYDADHGLRVFAADFVYCNGIVCEPAGTIVVVEARGLLRLFPDGSREWVVEDLGPGGGDGFCCDTDGRFYVAATVEHGVRVVDPDGTLVEFLAIAGEGLTTNCCFGGPDLRTLYVTDGLPGNLVAFEHMPTPGRALPTWPGPATDVAPT